MRTVVGSSFMLLQVFWVCVVYYKKLRCEGCYFAVCFVGL